MSNDVLSPQSVQPQKSTVVNSRSPIIQHTTGIIFAVVAIAVLSMLLPADIRQGTGSPKSSFSPQNKPASQYQCPTLAVGGDDTGGTQQWETSTQNYNFLLGIGPPQMIWTQQQLTELTEHHCPLWGEVTTSKLITGNAEPVFGDYEVSITIKDQMTGQALQSLEAFMNIQILYHHAPPQQLYMMALYDPVYTDRPFHYGTNIPLDRQDLDKIIVTYKGQSIVFRPDLAK